MTEQTKNTRYDREFFDRLGPVALRSARHVVPMLMELVAPRSVIDIGCGTGEWLSVFKDNGVQRVRGLDGDYISCDSLVISEEEFVPTDLRYPFDVGERFDLATCLEVVEHLPWNAGKRVVDILTKAAPVVLFSAAIPGQGGEHHINEQWHWHWHELFDVHGFVTLDILRLRVFACDDVAAWYKQNLFLYVDRNHLDRSEELRAEFEAAQKMVMVPVSRHIWYQFQTVGGLTRALRQAVQRAIARRVQRLGSVFSRKA
jgi:SAM-dependent methyltransferase